MTGKELDLKDIADTLKSVWKENDSIIFSAFQKENVALPCTSSQQDIVENVEEKIKQNKATAEDPGFFTFEDYLEMSNCESDFLIRSECFPPKVALIEKAKRGQASNPLWFAMRKHLISTSKAHKVKTKMLSFLKNGHSLTFSEIPAVKYSRSIEFVAFSHFEVDFKRMHKFLNVESSS